MKTGLLGVGIKSTDYSISLSNTLIPVSKNNFATNQITYNQGNTMACTVFACFTLLSNKFGIVFTDDFIKERYQDACDNYGANAKVGWYISKAVDYTRNWFNSQPELVEQHGKLMTGFMTIPYSWVLGDTRPKALELFEEIIRNGHDFIGGHNGSRDYNLDFQSDGVLNLKKLSNPTYAHCICMSGDIQGEFDMDSDIVVANSWKGVNNNVYRLQYIQELIDNNVLFPTVYTFFSERDEIVFSGKDYTANIENELVKRFNNSYVMLSESTGAIYDVRGDKLISVDKFFKDKDSRENLIKTYEPINLLTGVSDDNFYTMVK